ncbi:hypothetical protein AC579_1625 [Pseudocercospora musae]|uniref:Uncharacterized protein n=1 Tax=Pseudocercospora musae TaxID=113226 RepID=A0A139HZS9_9PEZI|nr:hypothetical protein AC579_1625 [Pseudocercospora musae]
MFVMQALKAMQLLGENAAYDGFTHLSAIEAAVEGWIQDTCDDELEMTKERLRGMIGRDLDTFKSEERPKCDRLSGGSSGRQKIGDCAIEESHSSHASLSFRPTPRWLCSTCLL